MRVNAMKQALRNGKTQLGTWLSIPEPLSAERVASVDWDWLLIDMEHGPIDIKAVATMCATIMKGPASPVPIVRVPMGSVEHIKRVLDAGSWGILAPMVLSASEAQQIVAATKYPPEGIRSVGGARAILSFDTDNADYFAHANDAIVVAVQIEHIDAVNRVDEILSVPGIDAAFIGPSDLSASMGLAPSLDQTDSRFEEAVREVVEAAKRHHVAPGIMVSGAEGALKRIAQGFTMLGVSTEATIMTTAMRNLLSAMRR